eukprot:CAMPEP_0201516192 /NCGR_PEP_ID=MMETSP0161_2-20130828/7570_1 /ASSEMBLY_ACC=CAM_ASM_000251 /TAXON_ID=180227 /ORGANISM="Neoparamoeba aestuarina, Strain SoJaBio B1-5/56/2" /LENGTH=126 /DNA_ID=CAMNT_0047913229 /DNA_START=49 /DNA_END=429 /DNA_ORIENTATION=+
MSKFTAYFGLAARKYTDVLSWGAQKVGSGMAAGGVSKDPHTEKLFVAVGEWFVSRPALYRRAPEEFAQFRKVVSEGDYTLNDAKGAGLVGMRLLFCYAAGSTAGWLWYSGLSASGSHDLAIDDHHH